MIDRTPAYPVNENDSDRAGLFTPQLGMTIRDRLVMAAMQGDLSCGSKGYPLVLEPHALPEIAQRWYRIADAVMAARNIEPKKESA